MKTKEIIGYKLINQKFEKAAIELAKPKISKVYYKAVSFKEIGNNIDNPNRDTDFKNNSFFKEIFKEAGVLDIWFTPVYKKESEETYCVGQRFIDTTHFYEEYILALVGFKKVCLIHLEGGNRFQDPITVEDSYNITQKEFNKMSKSDISTFRKK